MKISRSLLVALGLAVGAAAALAFSLNGRRWPNNTAVPFSLRFGTNGVATPFQDGTTSFDQVAEQAVSLWNNYLGSGVRIAPTREVGPVTANYHNEAGFQASPFNNQSWGSAIALTYSLTETDGTTLRETDIIFRQAYFWNSYRGPLQRGSSAASTVYDFRRTAIHEFGHALGLSHPDENGQSVNAIMNSAISDVDVMQLDDINGIQALYGRPTPTPAPTPTSTPTPTPTPPGYVTPTPTPTPTATPRPTPQPTPTPTPTPRPTPPPTVVTSPASLTYYADSGIYSVGGQARALVGPTESNVKTGITADLVYVPGTLTQARRLNYTFDFSGPGGNWRLRFAIPDPSHGNDEYPPLLPLGEYLQTISADSWGYFVGGLEFQPDTPSRQYYYLAKVRVREVQQNADRSFARLALDFVSLQENWGDFSSAISGSIRIASDLPPVPPRLANLSTRLRVGTGDGVAIAGFVVSGTDRKSLVIRALGPSLSAAGVSGVLADPAFDLFDSMGRRVLRCTSAVSYENPSDLAPNSSVTLLSPRLLPSNVSAEAAVAVSLAPGAYTVVASPEVGAPGVGIVEIYEFHQGNDSRPINISTRGMVGTNDEVMIAGFIVQGPQSKRVIVRALGPSLGAAGVAGTLVNPRLELRNAAGQLLMENDDWRAGSQAAEIQTIGRAPSDEREAVIIASLPAGSYTAIVRGVGDTTGVALVEVYDLDAP